MKRVCLNRFLSLLLVATMVFPLSPAVFAAQDTSLPFHQVEYPGTLQQEREPVELLPKAPLSPTERVRVSIVLEDPSTIERGYTTSGVASNSNATAYRDRLNKSQETMAQTISRQALHGQNLDVVWNLTLAANLISANVEYGQIAAIQAVPGVKDVVLETRYEPAVYSTGGVNPNMATSSQMIGSAVAYGAGYTGAGMRIAVIDTGTDTDHRSFDAAAFDYAIAEDENASGETYNLLDTEEIEKVLPQLNAYQRTLKNGHATADTPTADRLYINTKLPFGYNYVDGNFNITHDLDEEGEHGSHVAGIATANRYVSTEDGFANALTQVFMQGVAPDAQLITMKVFGESGGAYDSDYMAAIEDAILLGCDAVNLSLGSSSPGYAHNSTYEAFLEQLEETDTVVTIAVGNAGSWADGTWNGYLYSDTVSMDMVGSPASYTNSLAVASADNAGYTGLYFTVADKLIFYTETISGAELLRTLAGERLEYVLIDGLGNPSDWIGIDLAGKVAVCARGDISFSAKAQNAADAGAAAVIIYNNTSGSINMDLTDYTGTAPCVSVTQEEGNWMREQGTAVFSEAGEPWYYTGNLTVSSSVDTVVYDKPVTMSDFSSWGVPGSLELKPEITAPGGNIYSVNGAIAGGQAYEIMSGTSMAAPQVAGMAALVAQYIGKNSLADKTRLTTRVLSQSLLMSTAEPLMDAESGSYYPVIQQGAGLANVGSAVSAGSYVLVDGQPDGKVKAELGDDSERTGVYSFSFTLNNLTQEEQTYLLSADLFAQATFEDFASENDAWCAENGMDYNVAHYMSKTTTALDAQVTWVVDGKTLDFHNDLVHMDFNGDGDIGIADGQALLDYASGNRDEISQLAYADLDGSGEVTTYDAYLFLKSMNGGQLLLPAGGITHITVTMALTQAQKEALDEAYANGTYVQGYVFAAPLPTSEGVQGVTHSIPVLAYYGSWTDSSMFENGSWITYDSGAEAKIPYMGSVITNYVTGMSEGSARPYAWGANPISSLWRQEDYLPERAAINNQNGDTIYQYSVSPIRNAANARMQISNRETGEIYKQRELGSIDSGYYRANADAWYQTEHLVNMTWAGTDASGQPLPEGTEALLQVTLAPEYYVEGKTGKTDWDALGTGATLTTRLTIDNTAPEITSVRVDPINKELSVLVTDNQFVAAVDMRNPDNGTFFGYKAPNQHQRNEVSEVKFQNLSRFTGQTVRLTVYDYAANSTTYDVQVGQILGNEVKQTEFRAFWSQEWVMFNSDDEGEYMDERVSTLTNVQAATNVDGNVFVITSDAMLYKIDQDLQTDYLPIRRLDTAPTDLAYNPADGFLYGVSEKDGLVRIDKLTGACSRLGMPGIRTGTLACDDTGTFYCLGCDDNGLYRFTADTVQNPTFVATMDYAVNGDQQSIEWNHRDASLYWTQFDEFGDAWWPTPYFLQIDPQTGVCTFLWEFFNDPWVALFIRDESEEASWCQPTEQPTEIAMTDSLSLKVHETAKLTPYVLPWTATNRNVTWASSNSSVAQVDDTGRITALQEGTCVITATSALDANVTASCQVTVSSIELELRGALRDQSGTSRLFAWNLAEEPTWIPGPSLDFTPGAAAYNPADGSLYLQETQKGYRMHRVSEKTGNIVATSDLAASGVPTWDMAYCTYLGDGLGVGIYNSFLGIPASLEENMLVTSGWDLSSNLAFTTECSKLVAIASGGYEDLMMLETQEDGTQIEVHRDSERFYLLDAAGYIWIFNIFQREDGSYDGGIAGLLATDLAGKLPFLQEEEYQYCSMVEDPQTGDLILSYFTGDTNEIYLLYPKEADSLTWTAVNVGDMGDQVYPAVLYHAAHTGEDTGRQNALQAAAPVELQKVPYTALTAASEVPAGTLHATAHVYSNEDNSGMIQVSVQVPANSTNGLVDIAYDPNALTLERVSSTTTLSSIRKESDSICIGFADIFSVTGGSVATLTFAAKEDMGCTTNLTLTYLQQNEKTGTSDAPVDIQTQTISLGHLFEVTSEIYTGHHTVKITETCSACGETRTRTEEIPCPSTRFQDLTAGWYHDAIDEAIYRGLVQGVSESKFAPNNSLTRAQFITILHRLAGCPESSKDTPFTDIRSGSFYEEAVRWAYEKGYIRGISQSVFSPNAPLTREMAVTILWRIAGSPVSTQKLDSFTDASKIHPYANIAMAWAVEQGLVVGTTTTTLEPLTIATRAQGAVLVVRYSRTQNL